MHYGYISIPLQFNMAVAFSQRNVDYSVDIAFKSNCKSLKNEAVTMNKGLI